MRTLIALMLVALMLSACGPAQKPMPAPAAPAATPSVADDIGSVDQVSKDVSVDGLDDVDAGLADVQQLDI